MKLAFYKCNLSASFLLKFLPVNWGLSIRKNNFDYPSIISTKNC